LLGLAIGSSRVLLPRFTVHGLLRPLGRLNLRPRRGLLRPFRSLQSRGSSGFCRGGRFFTGCLCSFRLIRWRCGLAKCQRATNKSGAADCQQAGRRHNQRIS
jgi:hypothetical protein